MQSKMKYTGNVKKVEISSNTATALYILQSQQLLRGQPCKKKTSNENKGNLPRTVSSISLETLNAYSRSRTHVRNETVEHKPHHVKELNNSYNNRNYYSTSILCPIDEKEKRISYMFKKR